MEVRKAKLYIENSELGVFEGYTEKNRHWNGFDIPYFDKETSLKVLDTFCNTPPDEWDYKFEDDKFIVIDPHYPNDPYIYEKEVIDGKELYSIGGEQWCWHEKKEENI